MHRFLLCLAITTAAGFAAITNVRVLGATSTQAAIAYSAPNDQPCRLEVSEDAGFLPVVNDLSASLFAGADQDSRPGNVTTGRNRVFVIGKRTSELASDGRLYSRALQALTVHYGRITCGADTATFTFRTSNVPLGNNVIEAPPFDPAGFGNYAWPAMSLTDRQQKVIDPLTGILVRRVTLPGDIRPTVRTNTMFGQKVFDLNGAWTNPGNARSASASILATYSGPGGDPLFLPMDPSLFLVEYRSPGGWAPTWSVDDLRVRAYGYGSDANAENRKVVACWSEDSGQTCATSSVEIVLPAGTPGVVTSSNPFPTPDFRGWGVYLSKGLFLPPSGTVDVNGSAVLETALNTEAFFKQDWVPGAKIYIAGTAPACADNYCTISSTANATSLTIVENAATLSGAAYRGAALGLLVRKKTAVGTIGTSFAFDYAESGHGSTALNGATEHCSHNLASTNVDASGNPLPGGQTLAGYLCLVKDGTSSVGVTLYYIIPATGEVRLISTFSSSTMNSSDPPEDWITGWALPKLSAFDPEDPRVMYVAAQTVGVGGVPAQSIFRLRYTGDFRQWHPVYSGTQPPDNVVYTNIAPRSGGKDLLSQVRAAVPDYDPDIWGSLAGNSGLGLSGKYYILSLTAVQGSQDAPCRILFFDVTTPYATFTRMADSYSDPSLRWAGCHTSDVAVFGDYVKLSDKQMADSANPSSTLLGPHLMSVTQVYKSGAWGADTSLAADYADACPADLDQKWKDAGAVGNRCVWLRVAGEPCNRTANVKMFSGWGLNDLTVTAPYTGALPAKIVITVDGTGVPNTFKWKKNEGAWTTNVPMTGADQPLVDGVTVRFGSPVGHAAGNSWVLGENLIWPCAANYNWSMLQPLELGDLFVDNAWNSGEKLRVVRKTPLEGGGFELVAQRRAVASCGASAKTNGWTAAMSPTGTCRANTVFANGTPGTPYLMEDPTVGAVHNDHGSAPVGTGNITAVTAAYLARYNFPLSQISTPPAQVASANAAKFAGQGGSTSPVQSYPSKRQWTASDAEQVWTLDLRALNPSVGIGAEAATQIGANTVTPVAGTSQVYRIGVAGGTLDQKRAPLIMYAGRYILAEKSQAGTGSHTLTDADTWRYCVANANGECRTGSLKGEVYANVPNAETSGGCYSNQYPRNLPCAWVSSPLAAWATQWDISINDPLGTHGRRLTMGFGGPGRHYHYANVRALPDGSWMLVPGYWLDGRRFEILLARLPEWPGYDSVNRATFIPVPVQLPPGPAGSDEAIVEFGYSPQFYCTTRSEVCIANRATPTEVQAFYWESSDITNGIWNGAGLACATGCTITIPALPQRVLYYRAKYRRADRTVTAIGQTQVVVTP